MKLLAVLLILASALYARNNRANLDEGFDKLSKKTVVDLGPSPYHQPSQHMRKKLTCYSYSAFTVKQYDEGQKGAEWLSIVPSAQAACTRQHEPDEKVYGSRDWSGYFRGVKGTFVFFDAADGTDGGMPFAVFDVRNGLKVFEDSAALDYYLKRLPPSSSFQVTGGPNEVPRLTYLRVVSAGCNLKAGKENCWNKAKAQFGILQEQAPVCSKYEDDPRWGSAIAYPVSVLLAGSPKIKPVEGPVLCWPTD